MINIAEKTSSLHLHWKHERSLILSSTMLSPTERSLLHIFLSQDCWQSFQRYWWSSVSRSQQLSSGAFSPPQPLLIVANFHKSSFCNKCTNFPYSYPKDLPLEPYTHLFSGLVFLALLN